MKDGNKGRNKRKQEMKEGMEGKAWRKVIQKGKEGGKMKDGMEGKKWRKKWTERNKGRR
jgi:hypothetical protein